MRREVWLRAPGGTPVRPAIAAVFAEMFSEEAGLPEPPTDAIDTTAVDAVEEAPEVLSIDPDRYKSNADLIVAAATMGYLDGFVLDLTVGAKRGFWRKHEPERLVTNDLDPDVEADFHYDFRSLPAAWTGKWAATVLDPPYKLDGTPQDRGPGMANTRFGVGENMREYESIDAVDQLYFDGLAECVRVTMDKGYILVKVMDQVAGMRTRWESWTVANFMRGQGCRYVTSFFLLGSRKQPDGRTQRNPRNNYSQLMVFRKP